MGKINWSTSKRVVRDRVTKLASDKPSSWCPKTDSGRGNTGFSNALNDGQLSVFLPSPMLVKSEA